MKRHRAFVLIVLLASLLWPDAAPPAEMIRWVDEQGVIHFTDSLKNIPEKFRSKVTRLKTSGPAPTPIPDDKTLVKFQKQGELMVVQALLNEKTAAKFVVDTGASYTTISQAMANQLGLNLENASTVIPLQTANGVIEAPLVSVGSLEVGGFALKDLTVVVHDVFPDPNIAGLLGLNFLSQFHLGIDSKNGILYLEKK
jgi:clan AA aspartic protease (TIGR02281 family)